MEVFELSRLGLYYIKFILLSCPLNFLASSQNHISCLLTNEDNVVAEIGGRGLEEA